MPKSKKVFCMVVNSNQKLLMRFINGCMKVLIVNKEIFLSSSIGALFIDYMRYF